MHLYSVEPEAPPNLPPYCQFSMLRANLGYQVINAEDNREVAGDDNQGNRIEM
jgi:hypothetical protein